MVLEAPSSVDLAATLPQSVVEVAMGHAFYVELWATDSGDIDTGLVSVYADMGFPAGLVTCDSVGHTALFSLFDQGACGAAFVDELGGSQLAPGIGVEPTWARVAFVRFTAAATGMAEFALSPAQAESSAHGRGLVPTSAIEYGSCQLAIREGGACCGPDSCTDDMTETSCLATDGRYIGDGTVCADDLDDDGLTSCDDVCPMSPAPGGIDSQGRPLGDLDGDCDVDLDDFSLWADCFGGPGVVDVPPACEPAVLFSQSDLDNDGDVDLIDFDIIQVNFAGLLG